jgi:hypothetical protein
LQIKLWWQPPNPSITVYVAMKVLARYSNHAFRIRRRLGKELIAVFLKFRDCIFSTYPKTKCSSIDLAQIFSFLDSGFIKQLAIDFPAYPELVRQQADKSIAHCFDHLGSGPVIVKHGMRCAGLGKFTYTSTSEVVPSRSSEWLNCLINRSNRAASMNIWTKIDSSYMPIDWQIDFKSGYRWREHTWYKDIKFGDLLGVDIKVPWELSRMQHLPTLSLACCFAAVGSTDFRGSEIYLGEFRNQVLDFISTNPPGFGVNWVCSMDVAIRLCNLLIAYDIINSNVSRLDDEFNDIFVASIKAHARHIKANLEWAPKRRGNHYLANIVGLLFASIYLPCDDEADIWLSFSFQELISEVAYQFHEDGSNFEASVCYHRLSAEMVVWSSALLANLSLCKRIVLAKLLKKNHVFLPPPHNRIQFDLARETHKCNLLPIWFWERLLNMRLFTEALTRPDKLVVQFGDNDSGRFIILGSGEQLRADNNPESPFWSLDHSSLIAGIAGLVSCTPDSSFSPIDPSAKFLQEICGTGRGYPVSIDAGSPGNQAEGFPADESVWFEINNQFLKTPPSSRWTTTFASHACGLLSDMNLVAFEGMGCYVYRSPRFYLAVRCGELGLAGLGAHAHCDQLAIELVMDDENLVRDPGSFIYTALPDSRNVYRSSLAHHVPRVAGCEPADLTRGLFDLSSGAAGECLYFGRSGFIGRHLGYGKWVYRIIALETCKILIHDFAEGCLPICDPTPLPLPFSQGYGRVIRAS